MDMEMIPKDSTGAPWLDQPVMLHSSRVPEYGPLTADQLAFVESYWVFWYEADHRYGLPTIAFFLAVIMFFAFTAGASSFVPARLRRSRNARRAVAVWRYLSYKSWQIRALDWYSPPLGVWLIGALGAIFFLAMTLGPRPYYWPNTREVTFANSPPIATRAGWMSIACLPFVLVLAAKENPISLLTRVPHDRLMVFHRWAAWAMFVLALVHTFPFIIYHVWKGDMTDQWNTSLSYWSGVVALLAQGWLQFMSIGFIRNKFYETFKALHYIMAALFFTFLFIHCDFTLSSWDYLIAAAVLYSLCLFASQLRAFFEYGVASAVIEPLDSGAVRVSIPTTSPWSPGQHIFVRFLTTSLHGLTAHPFTICSLPNKTTNILQDFPRVSSDMVFYIYPRGGFTARLSALAKQKPRSQMRVLVDGPYGGLKDRGLHIFDRVLIIAGGAGAGFTLPILEHILHQRVNEIKGSIGFRTTSITPQQVRIVVAFKSEAQRDWYESTLRDLLNRYSEDLGPDFLTVEIHTTSAAETEITTEKEHGSVGSGKRISLSGEEGTRGIVCIHRRQRPNLPVLINDMVRGSSEQATIGVAVCGPGSMLHDVRNAAAQSQLRIVRDGKGGVWLYSEHFSW